MQSKRKPKWYDSQGQRDSRRVVLQQSNPSRTLISLVLLLGLVLLLLQQLSDTKKVAKIGQAIGLFDASEEQIESKPDLRTSLDDSPILGDEARRVYESLQLVSDSKSSMHEQSIWTYTLSRLTAEQQELLFRFFLAPKSTASSSEILPIVEECSFQLNLWLEHSRDVDNSSSPTFENLMADNLSALAIMLDQIAQWRKEGGESKSISNPFRLALDQLLLKRFLDNQNWMSKEQMVALRSWARIRELRASVDRGDIDVEQLPNMELAQVMGVENASYRGVPLRFLGTIASVDERTGRLQSEEWNGVAYRVWWMKPSEINPQPVAVYVPIELEPSQYEGDQNSELEIFGFFTKRKAYASQRGPEIAPVIFAAGVRKGSSRSERTAGPLSDWLAIHRKLSKWEPPPDFATPLQLIKSACVSLPKLESNDVEAKLTNEPLNSIALSLLMLSRKHDPELRILSQNDQTWSINEHVKVASVRGWCRKVTAWKINQLQEKDSNSETIRALQREGFQTIYELTAQKTSLDGSDQFVVYTNSIPDAWVETMDGSTLELLQPIEVYAFQHSSLNTDQTFFVANGIAWKWPRNEPADLNKLVPQLDEAEGYLLKQGWDLSQKDVIQKLQSPAQPLSRLEEEGLFSLLRITEENNRSESVKISFTPTSIVQIVKSSLSASSQAKRRPSLLWTEGKARVVRVTKISIDSPSQRRVLGQDHYYQLDCFADIGNVTFEIPTESESITYAGEYPMTCVVLNIPDWLSAYARSAESNPSGEQTEARAMNKEDLEQDVFFPRLNVKLAGWFYRFWSYRTQEMTQRLGGKHRQITPLVIAASLDVDRGVDQAPTEGTVSSIAWITGLVAVGAIWWAVRSYGASKRDRKKKPIRFKIGSERDSA